MKRINTKTGLFSNGDARKGIPGTVVTAEWCNNIQEEIVSVIGAANLNDTLKDQLLKAIKDLIKTGGVSPTGSTISATDQAKIDSSYLKIKTFIETILGTAINNANATQLLDAIRKLTNVATQAEVDAGLLDNKIVTPKKLKPVSDKLKVEITTLETSIRNKINELAVVDDGLRKDLDKNTGDINNITVGVPTIVVATETAKGVAEIATQTEVNAGLLDDKIVTPKKLKVVTSDLDRRATRIRNDVDANTVAIVKLNQGGGTTTTTNVPLATETTAGKAEIATQSETTAGIIDNKIITPKKLEAVLATLELSIRDELSAIKKAGDVYAEEIDKNSNRLVTHRTDIQQNTTDIVRNTASIATIIDTIKKGITTDKLAQSFTVPSVLHDKIKVSGEDTAGHYGYALAMHNDYLAISDPVLQEVVIYHRDKNNSKIFNLEDVHKGKKHGDMFGEDGQIYIKRSDGVHLDVFKYDETQTTLTFKKVSSITLTATYGNSLAINDDYLIVGNPQAKTALIYEHSGIHWQLVKKLTGGDSFGSSVAVTDNYIIIAEPDNKKIEIFDLNFNKVKTFTGGASYSKVVDGSNNLLAVAEPDNNILKIYYDTTEIDSRAVKADCISVGKNIGLATSKTDKKAYIYDFFSKTGWFTTTRTKWSGLPDNTQGYTGYNIKGGQYQLVRPTGATDTYTKYKGGAWVKNGKWGGVLWYLGSKIGISYHDYENKTKITRAEFEKIRNGVDGINLDNTTLVESVRTAKQVTHPLGLAFESGARGKSIDLKQSIKAINQWVASNPSFSNGTLSFKIKHGDATSTNILSYKGKNYDSGYDRSSVFFCIVILNKKVLYINMFTKSGSATASVIVQTELYNTKTGIKADILTSSPQAFNRLGFVIKTDAYKNNPLGLLWFVKNKALTFESAGTAVYNSLYFPDAYNKGYNFYLVDLKSYNLYLDTKDGKHYYDTKEIKAPFFNNMMEALAPYTTFPNPIVLADRNVKLTATDIQEQPNKTGKYVSLLGTGAVTTPQDITKLDTNFTIDNNYGDACAITTDKILITNKTDSKLAVYDLKGNKLKEIQLEAGVGSTIDATDKEAFIGSETANKITAINLE